MKLYRLFLSVVTGFCLVGASGAAIAANTCDSGYITGIVDEDIVISGGPLASCLIDGASVNGDVIARRAADVTIQFTDVRGVIRIVGGESAVLFASTAQNIRLARNTVAILLQNIVNGNIGVNRNGIARVRKNVAVDSITCSDNTDLEASFNSVGPLGTEDCR